MNLEELIVLLRKEVRRQEIPVDRPAYQRVGKDPAEPILFAGSLDAPVAIIGRDLGKDEVKFGQPLIGAGGKLVRRGILRAWETSESTAATAHGTLDGALRHALLTNTVPFKPPGNKAYSDSVKDRFRPFLLQLLTQFWSGHHIITLGSEAFRWFEPYGREDAFHGGEPDDRRFTNTFICRLPIVKVESHRTPPKDVKVLPLPHPSPLNRRWRPRFPALLDQRLANIKRDLDTSKVSPSRKAQ